MGCYCMQGILSPAVAHFTARLEKHRIQARMKGVVLTVTTT